MVVADTNNDRLQVLDGSTGAFIRSIRTFSSDDAKRSEPGRISRPYGLAASGRRLLLSSPHRVQCFSLGPMMSLRQLAQRIHGEEDCDTMGALLKVLDERLAARKAERKELRQAWEDDGGSPSEAANEAWRAQHEGWRARATSLNALFKERLHQQQEDQAPGDSAGVSQPPQKKRRSGHPSRPRRSARIAARSSSAQ